MITLKLFDTYGKNDERNKILNIVNKLQDGEKIDMTEGEQLIYLCHIDDVVEAFSESIKQVKKLENGMHKVYAVRGEKPKKLKDIINLYIEISKKNIQINWGGRSYRKREIMNPKGIGEVLTDWFPKVKLEVGLKDLLE